MVLQIVGLHADDGFYTRALCISRDGSFDPGEPKHFEPTAGFRTNPVRFSKKEKPNAQFQVDRATQVVDGEQPKKKKQKQGKLSAWISSKKQNKNVR